MSSSKHRDPSYFTTLIGRRDLFKLALGGVAASSVYALPWLRHAHGMVRPGAPAKRVLILYFSGGMRSSTAFHASPSAIRYNPWGVIQGTNTPFALGKLLDDFLPSGTPVVSPENPLVDAAYQLDPMGPWGGVRLPRLREIARNFSVVGSWNPARGDHYRASLEEPTGSATGQEPGLLTRIAAGVAAAGGIPMGSTGMAVPDGGTPSGDAGDDAGGATDAGEPSDAGNPGGGDAGTGVPPTDLVPAFHVEPNSAFGHSTEETVRSIPVPLFGTGGLPGQADLSDGERASTGNDWARDDAMRSRLDERRFNARVGWGRAAVETYRGDRAARRRIGERLAAPWINIGDKSAEASQGTVMTATGEVPLTNAMLYELFARATGPDPDGDGIAVRADPEGSEFFRTASDAALALRLFQLGSPAVVVEMGGFDTHSGERRDAPERFRFIGRLWATLQWILSRIPEPGEPGKTMFDRTVVMTMSEFGRDPGGASSGFNNGEGSDHGSDPSCYYYAHAIMGGGVMPGRLVGAAPANTYLPPMSDRLSIRRLHATLLWALGLDAQNPEWGFPDAEPITQLFMP